MTQQTAVYRQPGFAQYVAQRQPRKKKSRQVFVPTEQQVLGMVGCLTGALKSFRGTYYTESDYRAVANELLAARRVHCRGKRFGRDRREIVITICTAFKRMEQDGKLCRTTDSNGRGVLILKDWRQGRRHKDKYNCRPPQKRRSAAA